MYVSYLLVTCQTFGHATRLQASLKQTSWQGFSAKTYTDASVQMGANDCLNVLDPLQVLGEDAGPDITCAFLQQAASRNKIRERSGS